MSDDALRSPDRKRRQVEAGHSSSEVTPDAVVSLLRIENLSPAARLAFIHDIAVFPDHVVSKRPPVNPLEKMIKENMHKAFWDCLSADMTKIPPELKNAINLLLETKQILRDDLVLKDNAIRKEVEYLLDEGRIRTAIEQNTFNPKEVAKAIIDILQRLCAPARDEEVRTLRDSDTEDVVVLLRGIMKLMDDMKEDLRSFFLASQKEFISEAALNYEKNDLKTCFEEHPEVWKTVKDFVKEEWDHLKEERRSGDRVIHHLVSSYIVRVLSSPPSAFPLPFRLDAALLLGIADKHLQLVVCSATLYIAKQVGKLPEDRVDAFRDALILIANDIDEGNTQEVLERLGLQVKQETGEHGDDCLRQVTALRDRTHAVRKIMDTRLESFFSNSLLDTECVLPSSLLAFEPFIKSMVPRLRAVMTHNISVYKSHYERALNELKEEAA